MPSAAWEMFLVVLADQVWPGIETGAHAFQPTELSLALETLIEKWKN